MTLAQALAGSPALYPVQLNDSGSGMRFLRLSEADYASASFLDERVLGMGFEETWASWPDVMGAVSSLSVESDFIFHIGHVGSTLLSRLLGVSDQIFALREPVLLRVLATTRGEVASGSLGAILRLYSRVWRPDQKSLVKATSFVGDIAPRILAHSPSAKAILMVVEPRIYVTGILAGEATRAELPRLTPDRLSRLERRLQAAPLSPVRTPGEMAAAGWICEVCALAEAAGAYPGRIHWVDFDRFLINPRETLAAVLAHLQGAADPRMLAAMLSSPHMHRYSKAPEHPFSPGLRGQILRQASRDHATEIARGLRWLEVTAGAHPLIAASIDSARAAWVG